MSQPTSKSQMNGNPSSNMQRFTAPAAAAKKGTLPSQGPATAVDLLEHMRPTLLIFLGGTGQLMAVEVKALLMRRLGAGWSRKVRLLAFDTTEEPVAQRVDGQMIQLEAGSEFHNIGGISVPGIVRNLDNLEAIQARLGDVIHRLPASVMRNGAKQIRPLGLLSFLWHYPTVMNELRRAIWQLAGRDANGAKSGTQQRGINVFICSSLAGGTGSGMFLDVAYLVRVLFDDLGAQGEFSHITGIGVLPQAFPAQAGPNLYPNTAAALKELNHAMTRGDFRTKYPDGRSVYVPETPFNLYYVLDGVDEQGRTWSGIEDVAAMGAEAVFLQMASQLGRKGENAFDNVDEVLVTQTEDGDGGFLGSLGLGYLEFPAPAVVDLCSLWLVEEQIRNHWLKTGEVKRMVAERDRGLRPVRPEQLRTLLLHDPESGGELRLDLSQPGWLADKPADQIPNETIRYVSQFGQVRVNEGLVRQIEQNGQAALRRQRTWWHQWVDQNLLAPSATVVAVRNVLQDAQTELADWINENRRHLAEVEEALNHHHVPQLEHLESSLSQAAASLPFGRRGRLREAMTRTFQAAQAMFAAQLQQAQYRARQRVWTELQGELAQLTRRVQVLADRLETIQLHTQAAIPQALQQLQNGGVAHFSLADEVYARSLYRQYAPEQINLLALAEGAEVSALQLAELGTNALNQFLTDTLRKPFAPILKMNVEAVIETQAQIMTPAARRQQLFQLATPSWSVEWARLPEGGARLARLEVLGVPDKNHTFYEGEPMLVSTHDPYRLMALVVVAGAPQSALKQFDQYQAALDEARGRLPVHVLPVFLAEGNQSQLAFALGSIFGLIHNQGTYFYYQPSDPLQKPIRLGNGLQNAIQMLAAQEMLAREVIDRVDSKIAQMGLHRAIDRLAAYYSAVPNGKTRLDDMMRELKQQVRHYADELRQINELNRGLNQ